MVSKTHLLPCPPGGGRIDHQPKIIQNHPKNPLKMFSMDFDWALGVVHPPTVKKLTPPRKKCGLPASCPTSCPQLFPQGVTVATRLRPPTPNQTGLASVPSTAIVLSESFVPLVFYAWELKRGTSQTSVGQGGCSTGRAGCCPPLPRAATWVRARPTTRPWSGEGRGRESATRPAP